MSIYKREIDRQCCNQWMNGIRTINNQYPDDNREFTIIAGPGIKIEPTTAGIRITNDGDPNSFIAGDNIEFVDNGDGTITVRLKNDQIRTGSTALTGDVAITGDVQVNGDIVQQGSAYETHAEKVFTTKDYITMRDGAVAALAPGDYSGFQVKLYDGVNDGRLIIDRDGVARVGDVGDEQPLLTREESADLTDGALLKWDAANSKAVDEGTVGDDTHPIKIVNGVAAPITDAIPIENTTAVHSQSVSAPTALSALMDIPIQVAGTYLIVSRIEIVNAPVGTGILGVSKTYNHGWGITKTNTTTDYVRLTMSDVEIMSATDHVYINFYNGFGSAQTVNVRTTITKLA